MSAFLVVMALVAADHRIICVRFMQWVLPYLGFTIRIRAYARVYDVLHLQHAEQRLLRAGDKGARFDSGL